MNRTKAGPTITGATDVERYANALLETLPTASAARLLEAAVPVRLERQETLFWPGDSIESVYLPMGAVIALIAQFADGSTAEVAMIGRRGVLGVDVALGAPQAAHRALVRTGGLALKIPARVLLTETERDPQLRRAVLRALHRLLVCMARTGACSCIHSIEQRLCRWLFELGDAAGTQTIVVTHAEIAEALGTRRASISAALAALQAHGAILYRRGSIVIVSEDRLLERSCECYHDICAG